MNDRKTTPEQHADAPPRGRRRLLFSLGAVAAGLLPLLLAEAGLRVFDVGRPADTPDPFAGFNRSFSLFEQHGAVFRTTRSHAPFIAPQEFSAAKPRNGSRVFCFGGSTVYGHPYLGATAFPKWLELELTASAPSRSWEVINCGGVSYASYRIAPMVKEVLRYQPDLIILATGHNEFLEDRTYHSLKTRSTFWAWLQARVYSLHTVNLARRWLVRGQPAEALAADPAEPGPKLAPTVNTRLDYASGYASYHRDPAWQERVIAQFDESIRQIVADCQAARVPILLVRLGSNLRDCPPYKSEHRAGLAAEPEADWQAAFDLATAAEKTDLNRALQFYHEAEKIDPQHALLNFRIARVLDRLGRSTEALAYYEKARDEDVCPLRIIAPLEKSLARIAADTTAPLVDIAGLLAARSADHIPGNDWYVDHVHLNVGGHQAMARALAAQMRERGLLDRSAVWPEEQRQETYARHLKELGPAYFTDGRRRVTWLENWARRQRLAEETKPVDAAGFARLGFRCIDLGEDAAAKDALRAALQRDRGVITLIQGRARELVAEGRADRAAALLHQTE